MFVLCEGLCYCQCECVYIYIIGFVTNSLTHRDKHLVQTTVTELGDCLASSPSLVLIFHIIGFVIVRVYAFVYN